MDEEKTLEEMTNNDVFVNNLNSLLSVKKDYEKQKINNNGIYFKRS